MRTIIILSISVSSYLFAGTYGEPHNSNNISDGQKFYFADSSDDNFKVDGRRRGGKGNRGRRRGGNGLR